MYIFVVLLTLISLTVANPSLIHGAAPVAYSVSVAAVPITVSHQYRADISSKPYAQVAAPVVQKSASYAATPIISEVAPALAYAFVHITRTAYAEKVDYVQSDVVTGYTYEVIKPHLGYLATALDVVSKSQVLTPARAGTVTSTESQVEQAVKPKKVEVPVPVKSEVEERASKLAQPAITYAAPALATSYAVNVSPVVPRYSFATHSAIAPVVTGYAAKVTPLASRYYLPPSLTYTSPAAATTYICNAKYSAASTASTISTDRQATPLPKH